MVNDRTVKFQSSYEEGERILKPPASVTNADYIATLETLTNESKELSQRFGRLTPQVEEILNRLRDELKGKVGEEGLKKFREIIKQRHDSRVNFSRRPSPLDRGSVARLAAERRDARARIRAVIEESGVKSDEINELYAKYRKKIKDLFNPSEGGLKLDEVKKIDRTDVPKKVLEATESNQPITKLPPFQYNYYSRYWYYYAAGVGIDWATYLDWQTGKVGDRVDIWNSDAGELGYLRVHYDTDVGYYKNIPKTGKWKVFLKLNCDWAYANQYFDDESGWFDDSGVESQMTSTIRFSTSSMPPHNLANDNPYAAGFWWGSAKINDSPDGNYTTDPAWEGEDHWFTFTTSDTIPAKNSTFIRVGLYDDIDCDLNQYSSYLTWRNRWFIKQVSIEIL